MNRIDEIKERVDTFRVEYVYLESMQTYHEAESDMRYLLDRITKLEKAVDAARIYSSPNCGCPLCEALAALDNDDEKETTHE